MRKPHRRARTIVAALAAAAIAALALTLVPGAQAHATKAPPADADTLLYRGATTVALDPGAAGALTSLGIQVAPTGPADASKAGISSRSRSAWSTRTT